MRGRFQSPTLVFAAVIGQQTSKNTRRHSPHILRRLSAPCFHAHEADVQRQAQFEAVAAPTRDQIMLSSTEADEGVQSKQVELARNVALAKIWCLPRRIASAQGPSFEKPNSNAREINSLPNSTRAVAGSAYRHLLHRKQRDPVLLGGSQPLSLGRAYPETPQPVTVSQHSSGPRGVLFDLALSPAAMDALEHARNGAASH